MRANLRRHCASWPVAPSQALRVGFVAPLDEGVVPRRQRRTRRDSDRHQAGCHCAYRSWQSSPGRPGVQQLLPSPSPLPMPRITRRCPQINLPGTTSAGSRCALRCPFQYPLTLTVSKGRVFPVAVVYPWGSLRTSPIPLAGALHILWHLGQIL
jgi:hypothetical protein